MRLEREEDSEIDDTIFSIELSSYEGDEDFDE